MRARSRAALGVATLLSAAVAVSANADISGPPTVASSPQQRSVDPVVLAGNQFPGWSAGPEVVAREPGSPLYGSTVANEFDVQAYEPEQLRSDCYDPGSNPYDDEDNGDHSCVQESRIPRENNKAGDAANGVLNTTIGADVTRVVGYRWDAAKAAFVQFPLQVDERFTRFISNNASDFAVYSGTDQELNYAFDREGFRYSSDQSQTQAGGDSCIAAPAKGSPPLNAKGYSAQPDPIRGLDDNDEVAFLWRDAGTAQAPTGAQLPDGVLSSYRVAVADPSNPANLRFAYVALSGSDRNPGSATETVQQWNAAHGYLKYTRDATADIFQYSQSSYRGYGAAPKGPYCTVNADGTYARSTAQGEFAQRRPGDGAWVTTDRYAFRYDGRWLMTQLRICPDAKANGKPVRANGGGDKPRCQFKDGAPKGYGPNLVDQWKARAFQQRPSGTTPCCGYEEEVNNWGGSSILFGERWGPVRVIRAAWGADSSTNNVKTETFYPELILFQDNLRVHVIPPFDGIYVMWDYRAGAVSRYYNPWQPQGVAIDGQNDEVFGNQNWTVTQGGVRIQDDEEVPVTGPIDVSAGNPDAKDCQVAGQDGICNDIDVVDPTFDGPVGALNWEQVAGPYGGLVTRWSVKQHSGGDAYTLLATPYYRDDSCFDDGTGSDPGPHLKSRSVDVGPSNNGSFPGDASMYFDPSDPTGGPAGDGWKPRVCWSPADGDPQDASVGDGRPRKFWNGDIATHGLHINLIADSDNAYQTVPIDEVDSEQRMVVLPPSVVSPDGATVNVGERFGRSVEFPLVTTVTSYAG